MKRLIAFVRLFVNFKNEDERIDAMFHSQFIFLDGFCESTFSVLNGFPVIDKRENPC